MWDPYAEFEHAVLPNGLNIYIAYWPNRPWETVGFLIHSGAEQDPIGLEGTAHFVEHLVSKNTSFTKKEMDDFFYGCGGDAMFGRTGYDRTKYHFFVPTDKVTLARSFLMFGDMLFSAKLENYIERERKVIIGEFHREFSFKIKYDLAIRENKALYPGFWLERFVNPLGNPESIRNIAYGDLQRYYDRHYTPANMSIICIGGVMLSELIQLISESPFGKNKEGSRVPLPTPASTVGLPLETGYVFSALKHTAIDLDAGSYHTVAKIPGNINIQVLQIFYRMLNEVLDDEIRQKRAWTYSIRSYYENYRHFYKFFINGSLSLGSLDRIDEVIKDCISLAANNEELFNRNKKNLLAGNYMIDSTSKTICDIVFYELACYWRIISLKEREQDIERVTVVDIQNLQQWLQPEYRWTLLTRP